MNDFITSILDLTKIESRNLTLNLESKDINGLLESSVEKLKFEAKANNMKISKQLEPLYPIKVDPILIDRVFGNIIGNAIKYSGKDTEIIIKSWDDDQWVYVDISDNGKGISPDDLENIFEKILSSKK